MTNSQSGNVLFLILIAVALFAALSYAVTSTGRTNDGGLQTEKQKISKAELDSYTASLNQGKMRLRLINRCSTIDYTRPEDWAPGDKTCHMFHPEGGGVVYRDFGYGVGCDLPSMELGENCNGLVYAGEANGSRIYTTASDQGTYTWNNGTTNFTPAGTASKNGGPSLTDTLVSLEDAGAPYEAAEACRAIGSEWYLPDWDELTMMAGNRLVIGGFTTGAYWSASEFGADTDQARPQRFNGSPWGDPAFPKDTSISVRCVRRD